MFVCIDVEFCAVGITFNVTLGVGLLQMSLGMPNVFKNKTIGLLGNFNGNSFDDLKTRNGTVIPKHANDSEIFHSFGQTCEFFFI